jgi:hypothetical protein
MDNIFKERKALYLSRLNETDNPEEHSEKLDEFFMENITNLIKELTTKQINIKVVNYYKKLKDEITKMIDEKKVYQNNNNSIGESSPQAYLEIKIFKHASIPLNLINNNNTNKPIESIDTKIYKIAEAKYHNIERVLSIMRKHSVGSIIYASINKDREETDDPKDIDYNNYNLVYSGEIISNIKKQIIDICRKNNIFTLSELSHLLFRYLLNFTLNALNKLLSYEIPFLSKNGKSINDSIIQKMKELFSKDEIKFLFSVINKFIKDKVIISQSLITEERISPLIERYEGKFIIMALESLISEKVQLLDKFGYIVYMREDNGYFYLDKNYPSEVISDFRSSYYTDNLVITKKSNLEDISNYSENLNSIKILEKIKFMDLSLIIQYLESLSIKSQAIILENVIIEALKSDEDYFVIPHNNNNYIDLIINKYQYYIIFMNEPYSQIKSEQLKSLNQGPRPGRPANNTGKKHLQNIKSIMKKKGKSIIEFEDEDTELVYIHTLYSQQTDRVRYGQVARVLKGDGRKRIIKINELNKGWRDIIDSEKDVYNELVQPILNERNDQIIEHSEEIISKLNNGDGDLKALYGFIMDGEFYLVDKEREDEKAESDTRNKVTGRKSQNFQRPYLIEVLWRLNALIPDEDEKGYFNIEITEDNKEEFVLGLLGETHIYYHGVSSKNKMKLLGVNGILKRPISGEKAVNYTYDELIEWDLYKLNFYYRWNVGKFIIPYMKDVIRDRMIELDIIEYY